MPAALTRPGLCRVEQIMGTAITLDLADDLPPATLRELADDVFAWMREVDARFSTYKPDSEVCRFDRGEVLLSEASADLRYVLETLRRPVGRHRRVLRRVRHRSARPVRLRQGLGGSGRLGPPARRRCRRTTA